MKLGDISWEIEPQVSLGTRDGLSVPCKPDFVFWPKHARNHRPVAVFTDGFLYHKDIVADDTLKREAIRRSGKFRVWTLSYKDVQSVFAPQRDYYTETLDAGSMPFGKKMYPDIISQCKANSVEPAKLSSFDLLFAYLKLPDAEMVFTAQAYAYSLSLLDPSLVRNDRAFNEWKCVVENVNNLTNFTDMDFTFPGTMYGTWIPRNSAFHLAVYSGITISAMKAKNPASVCAILDDDKDRRTDRFGQEWNGFWRFHNVMQFAETFIAVSATGLNGLGYDALTAALNVEAAPSVHADETESEWNAVMELLFDDDAKAFAVHVKDAGAPAPDGDHIGYDVAGDGGEVIATVEIAWPDKHIGFMTAEQAEYKEKLEILGWKIISPADAADLDAASLFGGNS